MSSRLGRSSPAIVFVFRTPVIEATILPVVEVSSIHTEASDLEDTQHGAHRSGTAQTVYILVASLALLQTSSSPTSLMPEIMSVGSSQLFGVESAYGYGASVAVWILGVRLGDYQIFSSRTVLLSSLATYLVGSAIRAATSNVTMFILARVFSGLGVGGMATLSHTSLILSYKEAILPVKLVAVSFFILSICFGPLLGAYSTSSSPQYTMLVFDVFAILLIAPLSIRYLPSTTSPRPKFWTFTPDLTEIFWSGILIGLTVACTLLSVVTNNVPKQWRVMPILGMVEVVIVIGVVVKVRYTRPRQNHSGVSTDSTILVNCTTISGLCQIFLASFILTNLQYFLTIYAQTCLNDTPIVSCEYLLWTSLALVVSGILVNLSITITTHYRAQIWLAWSTMLAGLGIFSTLTATSPVLAVLSHATPVFLGLGMVFVASYWPVLSPLPAEHRPSALPIMTFLWFYGQIWGINIGNIVFRGELLGRLPQSADSLSTGIPAIATLPEPLRSETIDAVAQSLRMVWVMLIVASGVGLLASLFMGDVRPELDSLRKEEFGQGSHELQRMGDMCT